MDASILMIGGTSFLDTILEPVRQTATFIIEVAPTVQEALPLIQAQQPDLILVDAEQPDALNLLQHIKTQNRLAWIYCLLLDTTTLHDAEYAHVEALNAGADAYLPLKVQPLNAKAPPNLNEASLHLLLAQVQVGLRRVHNHRELLRTNDLLSAIALSDPLTELNNRRALEWELPRQINNARVRHLPISVIMLDVDYFKSINDNYGHLVGDRALQLLSARLRHNLRFYDTPFRYGGEEFVILLQETDYREATQIARRICRLIANQPFTISPDLDLHVTISAGAASLNGEDDTRGTSLLHRADQNLLKAKSLGRNRVIGHEEE